MVLKVDVMMVNMISEDDVGEITNDNVITMIIIILIIIIIIIIILIIILIMVYLYHPQSCSSFTITIE